MAIGDLMPVYPGMTTTFSDDFTSGLGKWPNNRYPWLTETVINGEQQFYVEDQSLLNAADRTVFINGSNNMVLRCMNTPSYFRDQALVVLNGYSIARSTSTNQIDVYGENFYNRDIFSNEIGIGWNPDPSGFIKIGNNPMQQYSQITPLGNAGTPEFRITLTSSAPSDLSFKNPDYRANVFRRQPQISGMATTQNTQANGNTGFSQKFGRFMARVKAPSGKFCFPAFWLWRDYEEIAGIIYDAIQKGIEFDIWEILGHAPDISYHTLHSPGFDMRPDGTPLLGTRNGVEQWKTSHMQQFQRIQDTDFSQDFHWVALDWFTDNSISWYVEIDSGSNELYEVANALANPAAIDNEIDEAMLILNNAYGSDWSHNQAELYDSGYENFVDVTPPPWDLEISDVVVQQFSGLQTGGGNTSDPITRTYTTQTVIGPEGTIDDVVVLLPTRQTDRQGTVHEIEARIAYRPRNIKECEIGIEWEIVAPSPLTPVFVDGNNKSWRARIHMTTSDTSPLPEAIEFDVNITNIYLKT